ncbi:glycosyl transferase [Leeuwenhoekiella sp. H156]|uniref:glycosyl transferase n=1 Tax=Leeuwenhoekiella sp. H156 TaxID=3450128 RepID=UPI003FA45F46
MKIKELPVSIGSSLYLKSLSKKKLKEPDADSLPLVVSLTAIPSRFKTLDIVIRSVLRQQRKPEKIVLWITKEHRKELPDNLKNLTGSIFEIRDSHLYCSHKKLIHSLEAFPDKPVVTCDDDVIYRQGWLDALYESHLENPQQIVAHRIRCIKTDKAGNALAYKRWNLDAACNPERFLPIGAEGVLYPPRVFSEQVQNEDLFLELAPKADDLWFKAIALKEGRSVRQALPKVKGAIPIIGTQKISLKSENVDQDRNRKQWDALSQYFGLQFKN